ncbi:hypothetical protein BOX15_Mlig029524g2, partial [Macrostomum lignano]
CCCWLLLVAAAAALLLCDEAAAQGTSCGKLVPGQVDPVTVAKVRSSTSSSITVDWLPPDRGITGYFYTVNCPSCPSRQHNTSDETFTFRGLTAATEYNFSIQAGLQNCSLSPAFHLSGRTLLSNIPGPVHISDVTETSFRARWAASPDAGVEYEVSCAGRVPDTTAVCTGQPSGASVTVRVRPVKTGFEPANFIYGTALTRPLLIADPASRPSAAAAVSHPSESLPAEAVLLLNWTSSAAAGADLLRFRVSSASKPDLLREAAFNSMRLLLSLAETELLSLKLTVAVAAVANKSGLRQEGSEIVIAEQLQMPPGRPSVSLLPDRRAVEVSLTASSGSELLTAAAHADSGSFAAATNSCRPDSGRCTVALQPLRPFTNYSVEAVAELSGLASLPQRSEVRTLEDAPSQPQSVRLDDASSQLLCDWRAPSEPNGVIRNYSVAWGSLSFPDGAEIRVGAKEAAADTTRLPLEPPPLPGHVGFCRVGACTGGGCSRGSDRAERRLPDGEAPAVSGGLQPLAVPGGPVRLSWKPLSPELGRGVVFEFELRLDGPGGCAAARRLNCSDCGRHRLQLQSEEARQRLEALTADCSAPVLVRTFKFGDASLSAEVAVSSEGASPNSLLPLTEYSASLWPVNLAGPGAVASASFRSPETRSVAVGGLRATPSEAEALVEFEEPRLPNGLLQAFAVQVLNSSSGCSQMLVLNSSSAPGCQLLNCSTDELLKELAAECGSAVVNPLVAMQTGGPSNGSTRHTVRLEHLQPGSEYSVKVIPVSQTLRGTPAQVKFATTGGGGGGGGGGSMTIVVAVAVSVLVAMAIAAGLLGLVWYRRRSSQPDSQEPTTSMREISNGIANPRTEHELQTSVPKTSSRNGHKPPQPPRMSPTQPQPPPLSPPQPPQSPSPPLSVPAAEFAAYAKKLLADAACLSDQQYSLMKQAAIEQTKSFSTEDGLASGNREKNRYINILPFDNNRVKLSGDNDYINASYVSEDATASSAPFIACQGPKPATVSDHWRMIWEQMVPVTVMLTTCVEKGRTKCEQYWPDSEGESLELDCGLTVTLLSAENCGSYIVRKLRLMPNTDNKTTDGRASGMDTELLQYMEWEDHAVPNLDNLAEFLGRVHRSQRNGGGGRIVLHCSAGVGRTGTFIALDLLARRLQDCQERQEVSVYETVLQLRRCRVDMVQTKHQYAFIYKFLLNFVQKKQRISAFNDSLTDESSNDPVYVRATSATTAAGRDNEAFDATNEA